MRAAGTHAPSSKKRIQVGDFRIGREERSAVNEVLDSGRISEWKKTRDFEKAFADYIGTEYCLAVSSGTAALLVGLLGLLYDERFPKAKKGAKVITSPLTYISTASAISLTGYEPVFVDIHEDTFKLDTEGVKRALRENGKGSVAGILPVHLMGYPNDMDEINEIARENGIFVFEDSAQAHGTLYKGKKTGSLGLLADFSFYIAHNIQAGEMGCITTDDEVLFRRLKQLKANGRVCDCPVCTRARGICPGMEKSGGPGDDCDPRFTHEYIAYNFKVTEFTSALALTQIKKADRIFEKRSGNVSYLNSKLKKYEDVFHLPPFSGDVSYLAYPLVIRKGSGLTRKWLRKRLEEEGVETRPLFGCVPTQQPAFAFLKDRYEGKLPVADHAGSNGFYIGCHQYLEKQDLDFMAGVFDKVLSR